MKCVNTFKGVKTLPLTRNSTDDVLLNWKVGPCELIKYENSVLKCKRNGWVSVSFNISLYTKGTDIQLIELGLKVNGSQLDITTLDDVHGDIRTLRCQVLCEVKRGDKLSLFVSNKSSNQDVEIVSANWLLHEC